MNKKQSTSARISFIHFLRSVLLSILVMFIVMFPTALLELSESESQMVSLVYIIINILASIVVTIYSAYVINQTYEIRDARKITLIASAYLLALIIIVESINYILGGELPLLLDLVELIIFYGISAWKIKDNVGSVTAAS